MAGEPNLSQLKVQMDTYRAENQAVHRRLDEKLDKLQSSIDSLTTRIDEQTTWLKEQFGENSEYGPISEVPARFEVGSGAIVVEVKDKEVLPTPGLQSFVGVNYGELADTLPPRPATAKLLQSTTIGKVRLYGTDLANIGALANTGTGIVIGAANGDIPRLASDPNAGTQWIGVITVGNEFITSGDQNLMGQLLPAMQNIQNAINATSLGGKIKVSVVHSMSVLGQSDPPSSGSFRAGFVDTLRALLQFQRANEFQAKTEKLKAWVLKEWIRLTDGFFGKAILRELKDEVNLRIFFSIVFDPGGVVS